MTVRLPAVVSSLAVCICAQASASVTIFSESAVYDAATAGMSRALESFASFTNGTYPSPLGGTTGPVSWTATATGGLFIDSGRMSTIGGQDLLISFGGVGIDTRGVSGNFFATEGGTVTAAVVTVELNDGTAQMMAVSDPGAFMGFLAAGSSISSIRISITSATGSASPTVDNLDFAYVPAPGSISLLAASLLLVPRRRR